MQGLVLKSTGKIYNIILENGEIIKATIRGKLRIEGLKTTNPIAAGDRVELTASSDTNSQDSKSIILNSIHSSSQELHCTEIDKFE